MEFSELKKIWNTQNNEPMYVINEPALHRSILSRKAKGEHITNISELLCIAVNFAAAAFIMVTSLSNGSRNAYMYILSLWMLATAVYCVIGRVRRRRGERQFDRTMLGDLDHAVSIATYQVRFSALMRWNILPVAVLILLGMWGKGSEWGLVIGLAVFFAFTFYASGWEHKYYKTRRRDIEALRKMLLQQ